MDTVTTDPEVAVAARAVAHALRPSHAHTIERTHGDPEAAIARAMVEDWNLPRTGAFWTATGPGLCASLETITTVTDAEASFLIGAALHATLLAKQDTAPDAILRLAERAACWDAGRRWVADRIT